MTYPRTRTEQQRDCDRRRRGRMLLIVWMCQHSERGCWPYQLVDAVDLTGDNLIALLASLDTIGFTAYEDGDGRVHVRRWEVAD